MGQQNFFTYATGSYADGTQDRVSPQFYYYIGSFGLLGEYISSRQEISRSTNLKKDIDNRAWQLAGYWVITGENASYHGVAVPNRPFAPSDGRWGAFELVTRYSVQTNDDDAFVGSAATQLASPSQSAREAREIADRLGPDRDRHEGIVFPGLEQHRARGHATELPAKQGEPRPAEFLRGLRAREQLPLPVIG